MLACTETVTLVRKIEGVDDDYYACTIINGVSWYAKTSISITDKGAEPVNTYRSRISSVLLPAGTIPHKGDYLVRGALPAMRKREDLLNREYFSVTAVGDNRRGSFPHWAVSGS